MTEASNVPNQPASPPPSPASPPQPPREVEIKFKGQAQKYDLTDAAQLDRLQRDAQLGRLYQEKTDQLKALQDNLKAKELTLRTGEQIETFKARNPSAARAVMEAVRALEAGEITPEQVLSSLRGQDQSQPGDPVAPTSAGDPHTRAALNEILARQQALSSELDSIRRKDSLRERTSEIDTVLASDELLRGRPALQEIVRERIQKHLDNGMELHEATALESAKARQLLGEQVQTARDQRLANQDLRTTNPNVGTPLTRDFKPDYKPAANASPRERTAASLKSVSEKAREFLRATMRGAVSGP